MKIRLNIDSTGYMNKPQGVTVAGIRNRLCTASSIREVEPEQFIAAVQRGRSWTPAAMTGTTSDTWQSQQVIAADIDNGGKDAAGNKVCIPDPLTPDQAIEVLGRYGINPYFMYYSFSNSGTWPRYRVVLILDQALTDQHEAKDLTARLANVLNEAKPGCTDTTIADNARLLFAGRADSAFYQSNQLTTLDALRRLPEIRKPEPPQRITRPTPTAAMMAGNEARIMDALKAIPCSSTSREEWVSVGMAINSMGWPFEVWDEWSASDPTRYSQRECLKIWRSFKPGKGIDHTFIIHLATENGWTPPRKQPPTPTRSETKGEAMQDHDQEQPHEITEPTAEPDTTQATTEQPTAKPSQVVLMLQEYETTKYQPIPTGIDEIDEIINGGFFVQTLVTLGAPPASGKTLIATQMFEAIAKAGRADICYCNLEMPPEQLIARSLSRMTGMNALQIMQGYNWELEQRAAIYTAAQEYEQTIGKHFYYMQTENAFYEDIIKKLTEIEEKRRDRDLPFIAVVDYIQLLSSAEKLDDVETIKRALKAFKNFAMSRNALVFLIMAHSRTLNESGAVAQGAGRDTSSLEYSADLQLSINYLEIANGHYKDKQAMKAAVKNKEIGNNAWFDLALVCTKNRFGRSGTYAGMRMQGDKSMFEVIPRTIHTKQQTNTRQPRKVY